MIPLGLRLVLNGGREAVTRLVILAVAVGLGVGLLLTVVAATNAVSSSPTPSPTATARMTSRVTASRPPFTASRSPSPTVPDPFIPERLASRSSVPTPLTVSPP